jgi:hypothetical protein
MFANFVKFLQRFTKNEGAVALTYISLGRSVSQKPAFSSTTQRLPGVH